jgi:excisionase family DNA binding protein
MTPTQQLDRDYLTTKQAADYLQVSTYTVLRMVKDGKISGTKLGTGKNSKLRISAASIEKMLEKGAR